MRDIFNNAVSLCARIHEKKFLVLNFVLVLLLFCVFPLFLLLKGADVLLVRQAARNTLKLHQELEKNLDELSLFSSNDRFAHFLLNSVCKTASGTKRDIREAQQQIKKLHRAYPGHFIFMISDLKGRLNEELSEEKGFAYLYRQAFSLLEELEASQNAAAINDMEARLRRLRPLLGDMLRENDLLTPLLPGHAGRSIMVSGSEKKFHLWYGKGQDFRIMAYISRDFIKSDNGLKWASTKLNARQSHIITGYTSFPPDVDALQELLSETEAAKVIRALAEHEEIRATSDDSEESSQISCRFLTQKYRGFSYRKKTSGHELSATLALAASIGKALFLILFVLGVYNLRNPISLSIKLKITLFFAYAILLPVLIIASITGEYIQQTEAEIIENLKRQSNKTLEKIDSGYEWYLVQMSEKVKKLIDQSYADLPANGEKAKWAAELNAKLHEQVDHDEVFYIDSAGKDLMFGFSPRVTTNHTLIRKICSVTIKLVIANTPDDSGSNVYTPYYFALSGHTKPGQINYLGVGDVDLNHYTHFLTDSERNPENSYLAMVFWKDARLQMNYIREQLRKKSLILSQGDFAIFNRESGELVFSPFTDQTSMLNFFNKSEGMQVSVNPALKLADNEYIAVAIPGHKLNKLALVTLSPRKLLADKINRIILFAALAFVFLCLITSTSAWLLSSWIFRPLDELKTGMQAISEHNFKVRLNVVCNNEMGRLIKAFNDSIETLQDLEVARIVQESLLPDQYLKHNNIEVMATTKAMSRLGGDYFDILQISDSRLLVFIGDATGHGIPAALSMAMAKSVLIYESIDNTDHVKIMSQLHALFARLRAQGVKDFMTAACAMIDTQSGEVEIINAGHCYPILLKNGGTQAELLTKIKGLPPGFSRDLELVPTAIKLEPGDNLVFYTDGLVESCNAEDQIFGFTGLQNAIAETCNADMRVHTDLIFERISRWQIEVTDDQTVVMVKYS
ncbi:MAG: hypothetical protein CVV41_05920 [Candidatus Riflebacteria bacterium HGW-Riflebacteria-1]|jgi:HAMP domain-containing protein|nr:MAG: hypothetical protein CVV41_05920 [Candidatus Riflebacteria bacterium HGW-Riflebacteria-1]